MAVVKPAARYRPVDDPVLLIKVPWLSGLET